jgi:DNA-binding response OmpR family regulator
VLCRATRVLLCAGAFDLEGVTAMNLLVVALLCRPFSIGELAARVSRVLSEGVSNSSFDAEL